VGSTSKELGQETDLTASRYSGNQQRTSYDVRTELSYSKVFDQHAINAWVLFHQNQDDMHITNQVYRYRNYAGNIHYGFDRKYFIDGTLSYSGTNRIQKSKDRFGLFPAIAGAWMISRESFLKGVDKLDYLKIRASYGKTGNGLVQIRDLTSDKFGYGYGYNFGDAHEGASGTREIELGIAHKKIETSLEANIGIDARFFNKLEITGEYFSAKRKNIFVSTEGQYSTILGLLPLMVPEGEVHNKGFELEATWSDRINDFNYYISGMFSKYKNEIINMNEEYRAYDYMKRTGQSIGQYFGWRTNGFFNNVTDIANHATQLFGTVKPGDIRYTDMNNDNYIDEYDQVAIGYSSYPEIYYSFSLGLGWKGIELSALFQGSARVSAYLSQAHVFWPLMGDDNISTWYTNYWSQSNQEGATLPRLAKQSDNNYRTNDIWIRNNSFLKLRYAELSYSFPQKLITGFGFEKLKVYLRGRDLFCFDSIDYVDPENIGNSYPSLRSYNIGIAVNF
jgi:TonB-linked SusC/RagA family outer membrane protein